MIASFFFALFPFFSIGIIESPNQPSLYIGGDVMLSRSVGAWLKTRGHESLTDGYNPFANATRSDITLLNLESPFSLPDRDIHKATFIFGANPSHISVLKWLQGESDMIVSLANNHTMNRGFAGLQTTLDTLASADIQQIGLGKGERQKFIALEKSGKKYCFGGYSYDGRSYWDKKHKIMWYINKLSQSKSDLQSMKEDGCEYRIFLMHWGREYKFSPTQAQRKLAHSLIESGATVVLGAHSHIQGEVEKYQGKYIFYSFGNFIFDQDWGGKGCQKNMDCIADPKSGKQIVPTNIGTAVRLDFPYTSFQEWQWYIRSGRFEEIEK